MQADNVFSHNELIEDNINERNLYLKNLNMVDFFFFFSIERNASN